MIQLNSSFKKLISSSGLNFIFRIFGLGTSFLTTVLITRFFGVGTFGDYSLVFALSQIIALLFTLGIPNTLIKIIGNNDFTFSQAKKLLIKGLKGSLVFSIIPILFFILEHYLDILLLYLYIYKMCGISGYIGRQKINNQKIKL